MGYKCIEKVIELRVQKFGLKRWRGGMKNKKTLIWYECKGKPRRECVYDGNTVVNCCFNR